MEVRIQKDIYGEFYTCYAYINNKLIVGVGLDKDICIESFEQGVVKQLK